jgi:ribosomal protein S18 acetylase RimI-like enzyme
MNIEVSEAPITGVAELGLVPISFNVDRRYDVVSDQASGRFALVERLVESPYVKDYDAIAGEGPSQWARRFEISRWGFIRAQSGGRLVGGAVLAFDSGDVVMLEGRRDLAVLWDIRVSPDVRGKGIGSRLVRSGEAWAISKGCRQIKVETQNINVPACRFYERQGFVLKSVDRLAYPELPGEIQLLWYKDLSDLPSDELNG